MHDVLVIGGGAAGFYAAIHIAESRPQTKIAILERGKEVLTKVKVSGGGRCNVTHAEFNPVDLSKNYPRGQKELLGPFHTYASGDTIGFFEKRGVALKIEEDGRMFPVTNSSQTIIDCFLSEADRLGVQVKTLCSVTGIEQIKEEEGIIWKVTIGDGHMYCKKLILATGSNPKMWNYVQALGHSIVQPVPSLFTFNIKDERILDIPGVATHAEVKVIPKKNISKKKGKLKLDTAVLTSEGPLLITHWGMSGPAILKLSAWGARILEQYNYQFKIQVNWAPEYHHDGLLELFLKVKQVEKKTVIRTKVLDIPKRLWVNLVKASNIGDTLTWPEVSKQQLSNLAAQLTAGIFQVNGKSTFKEEFVTAGGVDLKEINFKTYESKILTNLYFAGEIINVDAITGGFNFQNAWTGGYIAAQGVVNDLNTNIE
ncbi:MAG TPA: aminoacetone oxidase family FAD-binding enzyme [Maribacter sp.]|uniref:NAD(P)/FAD-dependent oxidoreductase n=1 Tax=unclassified Maribacter TaxID=2615042 RepID=UPI000EBDC012|nr:MULTISPECIES: NAD(P)/FAD-dependent oxidoreductase [unclassified Maribacter]HAF75800.1 aminoacetone oxidase family FAD-binding enzyme [Maribacter sp.]|tara:strand:- start:12275 stop:13555 length:1281 start_codon:yes stop_codon:yes gene_type:complete